MELFQNEVIRNYLLKPIMFNTNIRNCRGTVMDTKEYYELDRLGTDSKSSLIGIGIVSASEKLNRFTSNRNIAYDS